MGRVTVFIAEDCYHSKQVCQTLDQHEIPYSTVSLTQYPTRSTDLDELMHSSCIPCCSSFTSSSNSNSTPQVFFNSRHIGGLQEVNSQLEKWNTPEEIPRQRRRRSSCASDYSSESRPNRRRSSCASTDVSVDSGGHVNTLRALQRYEQEIASAPDPTDKRLRLPRGRRPGVSSSTNGKKRRSCRRKAPKLQFPGGINASVVEITEMLCQIVPGEDVVIGMSIHKRVVVSIVIRLASYFNISTAEAKNLTFQLEAMQIVVCLDAKMELYRLQCYHTPNVLNSYRVWDPKERE